MSDEIRVKLLVLCWELFPIDCRTSLVQTITILKLYAISRSVADTLNRIFDLVVISSLLFSNAHWNIEAIESMTIRRTFREECSAC